MNARSDVHYHTLHSENLFLLGSYHSQARAGARDAIGVRNIGAGDIPAEENDIEGGLARTQTFAAIAIVVLVIATVAVAVSIERPSDDVERSTWAYDMVQLDQVGEMGYTGQGVRVGLVDSGIDLEHPVMEGIDVVAWKDLVHNRTTAYDDVGHGTAMASIIAGGPPLRGGAVDVELIVVKVLDADHPFSDEVVADGIDFCRDPNNDGDFSDGADVISLSLGGEYEDIDEQLGTKTEAAIAEAVRNGVVVVAAAGNDGDAEDVAIPSRIPEVISVGAVDDRGQMAPFSSAGNASEDRLDPDKKPEVVAPGVDVVTPWKDGLYAQGSGTSHATAFTTAVVAAALSAAPSLRQTGTHGGNITTVVIIKTALMETARPLEGQSSPHDTRGGYGLVQAVDLVLELRGEGY